VGLSRRLREPVSASFLAASDALRHLDAAIGVSGIRPLRLSPRSTPPASYDLEFDSSFSGLIHFVSAIEAQGGMLGGLQVRRKEGAAGRLLTSVAVTVAPPDTSKSVPPPPTSIRDPFISNAAPRFTHRLTGITRVDDHWMATIDDHDYIQGDSIIDALVASIQEERVVLLTGDVETVLRFPMQQLRGSSQSGK
jgi:hypothetical protein